MEESERLSLRGRMSTRLFGLAVSVFGASASAQISPEDLTSQRLDHAALELRDERSEQAAAWLRTARLALPAGAELPDRLLDMSGDCERNWKSSDKLRLDSAEKLVEVATELASLDRPRTAMRLLRDARAIDPRAGGELADQLAGRTSLAAARLPHFSAELGEDVQRCLQAGMAAFEKDDLDGALLAWLEGRRRFVGVPDRRVTKVVKPQISALAAKLGGLTKDIEKAEKAVARGLLSVERRMGKQRWHLTQMRTMHVPAFWGEPSAVKAYDAARLRLGQLRSRPAHGRCNLLPTLFDAVGDWEWRVDGLRTPSLTDSTRLILQSQLLAGGRITRGGLRVRLPEVGGTVGLEFGDHANGVYVRAAHHGSQSSIQVLQRAGGQRFQRVAGEAVLLEAGDPIPDRVEFEIVGDRITARFGKASLQAEIDSRLMGVRPGVSLYTTRLVVECNPEVAELPEGLVFESLVLEML